MNKRPLPYIAAALHWGAMEIAGIYLILGSAWILFSDRVAARMAISEEMLATISLYKGWGFIVVTALLLYWMIRRLTSALQESEQQLHRVIDAVPAFISYVGADLRYRFTNKSYAEWFDEHAEGKHVEEVLGKGAYEIVSKQIDRALKGETISYETEVPVRDQERFFHITYVPDSQADGRVKGFFVLALDRTEQKQAEEERRLWADAFEGCAHGIAIGDPNTNRIVVCNPAFARMHKSRVEDIVGSAILSLYAPSDHEHVRRNIEKADQIGHASFEAKMTRRGKGQDQAVFPVQMDVVSVLGEDGELLHRVVTAQDISERKAVDEKLKESEAKYRTLVEHLPVITYISGPDQYMGVSYISPQIEALGFDPETWLADPELWFRQIHPDDQEQVANELHRFQDSAETFRTEYRLILPTGEKRWFHDESIRVRDEDGRTIIKQGFMLDITERKQAEEALQKSQRLLHDVIDNSNSLIYLLDLEGRFLLINRSLESALGRPRAELIGQPREAILPLEVAAKHRANDIQVIETQSPITIEEENNEPDGKHIYLSSKFPLLDQNGNLYGVGGISTDISERKQAEAALRNSQAQISGIFNSAMDAIISTDADQRILIFNPAAEAMFRCPPSEAIGQPLERFIPERFREAHHKYVHNFGQTGITNRAMRGTAVVLGRRSNGDEFPSEASISQIDIAGKKIYTVILRDISERKQAEAELSRSEERYHYLFENNPHPMWIYDRRTLAFLDVNEAAIVKYGYSRQEFLNMTIVDIRPPEDVERLMNNLAQPRRPLEHSDGWRHRLKDGTIIHVEITSHTILIDDHESALVVAQDITERKLAEEALRESEQKFSIIYYKAPFAAALSKLPDGVIIDVNEAFEKTFGFTRQEVTGKTSLELGINPDSEARVRITAELQTRGSVHDVELTLGTKSGVTRVFLVNIDLVGIGGQKYIFQTAQDITERKQTEAALQKAHAELEIKVQERTAALSEANALLQALMDNIPDHIYFKDAQCRFIRNSRSQAALLGLQDPSETVGKTDFDFFPHAAQSYADEQEVMRSGEPHLDFEEWVVWPDGKEMWVTTTKMPLRNSEGQTIGIFGISHDITERKRAEQAIQQLNTDLEKQAEQLQVANKELEAFSYSVSHDLRAPLRAIDGYTRILVEDYESLLDNEGKRICGVISREARRMGQLIDDLLAFSRLGRKEIYSSRIDMNALAASVFEELIKDENRERIDFELAKLPMARGDSSLIRQVWVNLLSNAIKFTSKRERSVIEVGSKHTMEENIYYVHDNGAGFDMEYDNKLFGVFQRLHSESEFSGTGVGLAIVQRIIRRHGGRVWAQGEVEKGATFYFALPRKENLS